MISQPEYLSDSAQKIITSLELFTHHIIEQADRSIENISKSVKSICQDHQINEQQNGYQEKLKKTKEEEQCLTGSLGLIIIGENHLRNIGSYEDMRSSNSPKKYSNHQHHETICAEFQQYNEFTDERQAQILSNKYKSNIVYLQIQIKQLMKLYAYLHILEQQKQIKNTIIHMQSQMRRLKIGISDTKRSESKQKQRTRKMKSLESKIHTMKNKLNQLSKKQDTVNNKLNDVPKINHAQLLEKHQKSNNTLRIYQTRTNKLKNEAIVMEEEINEQKEIHHIHQSQVTDCRINTEQCHEYESNQFKSSEFRRKTLGQTFSKQSPTQLQEIKHQSMKSNEKPEMLPNRQLRILQQTPTNRVRVYRDEIEYKKLLKQRIKILKQGIRKQKKQINQKISNITKQKTCLQKSIQLFKVSILGYEKEKRQKQKIMMKRPLSCSSSSTIINKSNNDEKQKIIRQFGQKILKNRKSFNQQKNSNSEDIKRVHSYSYKHIGERNSPAKILQVNSIRQQYFNKDNQ